MITLIKKFIRMYREASGEYLDGSDESLDRAIQSFKKCYIYIIILSFLFFAGVILFIRAL